MLSWENNAEDNIKKEIWKTQKEQGKKYEQEKKTEK